MNKKMNDNKNSLLKDTDQRIEELQEQSLALMHDYWDFREKGDKETRDFDLKSKIYPRIKETEHGFGIEWYRVVRWYKTEDGKRHPRSKYVPQGRGYRNKAIKKYAKDWELSKLEQFEDEAELIRFELRTLLRIKQDYKSLKKRVSKFEEKYA